MCGKREIWILRTHSGGVGTTPGLPLVASPLHAVRAQHRRFTRSDIGQNWSDVSTGTVSLATRGFIPGAHLRRCTRFVRRGHGRKQCYFCRSSFVSVYIWVCVCVCVSSGWLYDDNDHDDNDAGESTRQTVSPSVKRFFGRNHILFYYYTLSRPQTDTRHVYSRALTHTLVQKWRTEKEREGERDAWHVIVSL